MKQLTPSGARAIASAAYLFTFPLVMRYRHMYRQAIDAGSPTFSGGFATWLEDRLTEFRKNGGGRPQEDVVYSSTWLDLRAEPWWCAIDAVPSDVSFAGSFIDLWGFPIADLEPGRSGPVLAAAPQTVRHVPSRIGAIARGESVVVQLYIETRRTDPFRMPGSMPVRPDVLLEPVSSHLGRPVPRRREVAPWCPWFEGLETTDEFWTCASFALSLTVPSPEDQPILDQIARIGVIPGAVWTPSEFPDAIAQAIRNGMNEALSDLMEGAANAGGARRLRRSEMDRDYFSRALAALYPQRRVGL